MMLNEIHNVEMTNEIKNASVNEMENANLSLLGVLRAGISLVGLELVMFAFAIVVYFLFMGPLASKTPKKWEEEKKPKTPKARTAAVQLQASDASEDWRASEKEASPKAEKKPKTPKART